MLRRGGGYGRRTTRGSGMKLRLLIAGGIVLFSLFSYMQTSNRNPITGEKQRVAIGPEEEIQLGLQSFRPMADQHGGLLDRRHSQHADEYQAVVDKVGENLVRGLNQYIQEFPDRSNPYRYEFHLLADDRAINAFALPGGQIFITYNLFEKMARFQGTYGEFTHIRPASMSPALLSYAL